MKKRIITIVGIIVTVLLCIFAPMLFDRIIGVVNRSTKGNFKENKYTYKLDSNSDILPFDIVLLPDTDIKKKHIHAIVSYLYYPIAKQEPAERRYYEFIDDGSLALSNNLLLTEPVGSDDENYFTCKNSNTNFAIFGNNANNTYYYTNYHTKKLIPLFADPTFIYEPIAVDNCIYWAENKEIKGNEYSNLTVFEPETNSRTNLASRTGTTDLLAIDNNNLLYLGLENENGYLYRYNHNTSKLDSVNVAHYGSYIIQAYLNGDNVYFLLLYGGYEDEPLLAHTSFNGNTELKFIKIPAYQKAYFIDSSVGGNYLLLKYMTGSNKGNNRAVLISLDSGEVVKTVNNIGHIGINNKYLFYIVKVRDGSGFIKSAEIIIEDLDNVETDAKLAE